MATTTAPAIRDRAAAVIVALTPTSNTSDHFVEFLNEGMADFRSWAQANPQAATRRVQVRLTGWDQDPVVSNTDVEEHWAELEVVVAYPQTHRWGDGNAIDRDRVMDEDRYKIQRAIGLDGGANFAPSYPDATFRGTAEIPFERGANCDFLIISQKMSYLRSMT